MPEVTALLETFSVTYAVPGKLFFSARSIGQLVYSHFTYGLPKGRVDYPSSSIIFCRWHATWTMMSAYATWATDYQCAMTVSIIARIRFRPYEL